MVFRWLTDMVNYRGAELEQIEKVPVGSKLSVIPFSVILPSHGNISDLYKAKPYLLERHKDVVLSLEKAVPLGERSQRSEASMISQVIKWLSVSDGGLGEQE